MPLDPNIALGFQPPQLQNPLASIAQVQALKNQQQQAQLGGLELQQKQTELQQHQQVIQAFQQSGGDLDKAIATLQSQGNPQAFTLQQNRAAVQKSLEDTRKAHLDNVAHTADMVSRSAQQVLDAKPEVRPIVYQGQKAYLESSGLVPQGQLPAEYTGPDMDSWLQTKVAQGQSLKDRVDTLKNQKEGAAAEALTTQRQQETTAKQRTDALNTLSAAASPEDFQQKIAGLKARGVSDDVLKEFSGQTWTPELGQQLQTQALTPEQRTTAPKTAAETEAAQVKNAALSLAQAASRSPAEYQSLLAQQPPAVQKRFAALGASPKFNDILQVGMTPAEAQTAANERGRLGIAQQELALRQQEVGFETGGGVSPIAQGIVDGIYDPQTVRMFVRKNPGLLAQAQQLDKNFGMDRLDQRYNAVNSLAPGGKGQSHTAILALNTLAHHADIGLDAIDALNHGKFVPGNAAYDYIRQQTGSAAPNDFNVIKNFLSGEAAKVAQGGVPHEGEVNNAAAALATKNSPEQLKGALNTLLSIAGGRMGPMIQEGKSAGLGNRQSWDPSSADFTVVQPETKAILQKRGIDPNTMKPVPKAAPADVQTARTQYKHVAQMQNGDLIGSNDGKTWYDSKTGKKVQ